MVERIKKRFYLIIFFEIVLGLCPILLAQDQNLRFEYLTPNEGLSQASVMDIIKDNKGVMWFGTRNGLNLYDGYGFTKFFSISGDSTSLAGNIIEHLFIDSENNLWIGTDNGFSIFDYDSFSFINYKTKPSYPENMQNLTVAYIYEDSKGIFWLGTYGTGLVRFDKKSEIFKIYPDINPATNTAQISGVHAIIEDDEGNLWIGTDGAGLVLFDRENETFRFFRPERNNHKSLPNLSVYALTKDNNGTIWLGTLGDGICRIKKDKKGDFYFDKFEPKTDDYRRLKVLALAADPAGGLWVGTENGGLDYFDFKTETFTNYCVDETHKYSLNSNSIQCIYKDDIGNLWVGTYTGGVNVNKVFKKKFETISKMPGQLNSLSNNAVSCFYSKGDELWIGTDGGGLNILNRKTQRFRCYNRENSALLSDAVLTISPDIYGNVWVSGWDCGLNRYDSIRGTFVNYNDYKYGLPNNNIFDIVPDSMGNIWIAYGGNGLVKFNCLTNKVKAFNQTNSKLPNNWIFDLEIDLNKNIVIGHGSGFSIFNPDSELFTNFKKSEEDKEILSHNLINVILIAADSTYWIGTSNGLNHFNPKTKKTVQLFTQDGLPSNSIVGLVEDNHHNIWISTNNGIAKYQPQNGKCRNYNLADGLQGKGFIRNSCLKTSTGEILFGGNDGFNIFHPDSLRDNPIYPKIAITYFAIFNKRVKIGEEGSPLKKSINECDKIELLYKQSVISFEFAALEYTAPDQNQYAYKLVPFDKEWNEIGNNRFATYTNLDPGEYTLIIKASNNDGLWVQENDYKRLKIIVKPPFTKTIWFKLLIFILLIGSVFIFIRLRLYRLKEMNDLLEIKVDERTRELNSRTQELESATFMLEEKQKEVYQQKEKLMAQRDALRISNELLKEQQEKILAQNRELDKHQNELESLVEIRTHELEQALQKAEESDRLKSSFLANMSHEIRTPMNAILGFSSLLCNLDITDSEKEEYNNIIHKNGESLLILINDIIDISKIHANQLQLNVVEVNLLKTLTYVHDTLKLSANQKKINLVLKNSDLPDNFILKADEHRLIQVLNNLIVNAIKFTKQGIVEFGVSVITDGTVQFYVKDTGIGIPITIQKLVFERFMKVEGDENVLYRGTGLGLSISKSLVEMWEGKIWLESNENKGTIFYFTHPVN